jgi:hypothetical protein
VEERVATQHFQKPESSIEIATRYYPETIVVRSKREEARFQRRAGDLVVTATIWRYQCLQRPRDTITQLPAREESIPESTSREIYARN